MSIYLDNNATTPLDPRVISAMEKELHEMVGNPSSIHTFGQKAKSRLLAARRKIADYFQVKPQEVIFTSSGTEALNMVISGAVKKGHVITTDTEHACVSATLDALNLDVTKVPVGEWGAVRPSLVRKAIRPDTSLIVIMAANNETGVKTDIKAIAEIADEHQIPLIVDGVALLGKEPVTLLAGVSAFCFSGHKIHGPKGIGVAIIRKPLKLHPIIYGGPQEYGHRGGTENLAGIAGIAEAVYLLNTEISQAKVQELRDYFEQQLTTKLNGITINGSGPRVANTSNLTFEGIDGESLLAHLDLEGVAASHGSACSSGALEPSRVLLAMGLTREAAASSLRFSLSRFTTKEEIEVAVSKIILIVEKLRTFVSI